MSHLVKLNPLDKNTEEFMKLLNCQDLVKNLDLYEDYSVSNLYQDVCKTLKNDSAFNEKPLLKNVNKSYLKIIMYK